MRDLTMQWSLAFGLMCEVALRLIYLLYNIKPSPSAMSKFGLHRSSTLDKLFVIGPHDKNVICFVLILVFSCLVHICVTLPS